MSTYDLQPAARRLARLVEDLPVDALDRPTPCARYSIGDLLDHIGRFALAFQGTAVKKPLERAPSADAARLGDDWQTRIPHDLVAVGQAWSDPQAWEGMTAAGGVELPGEVAGIVALDELVVHGWDLAKATGQPAGYDGPGLEAVYATMQLFRSDGIEGIFGPLVQVPEDAPMLDRVLAVTGRDPAWEPPS